MSPEDKKTRDEWLASGSLQDQERKAQTLGELHGRIIGACAWARDARMPNKVIEALLRGLAGDQ